MLEAKITSSAFFFFLDERLYHDLCFDHIVYLRETGLPWTSITYHLRKRMANQSLNITAVFVWSRNGKEIACQHKMAVSVWWTNSLRAQQIILSSQNSGCVVPTMELEKSCMTKQRTAAQKCMNRTNIYRNNDDKKLIIILLQEFTIDNLKRRK